MDYNKAREVTQAVEKVVLGKEKQIREMMLAIIAGGHIILEDIPGVGKTTMALSFSKALDLDHKRVQFTTDLMPSDLTGFSVYRKEAERFVYREGTVFCNLLLADEINRTSPKTQAALLEVMQERKVTVDGVTREVPSPFTVIATQNPIGSAGTQMLPESQLDRFMVSMSLGYPDLESELELAKSIGHDERIDNITAIAGKEDILAARRQTEEIFIKDDVYEYIVKLIIATRDNKYLEHGASPRSTIALVKMSRAAAWFEGRDFVTPADVFEQFPFVVKHRIRLNTAARMEGKSADDIISEIIESVEKPKLEA